MKIYKIFILLLIFILFSACAPTKHKNPWVKKQINHLNSTRIGVNKYYYSTKYQKKLINDYKKRVIRKKR